MIRTQIQLSEEQSIKLKRLAAQQDKSVAELIRESIDEMLKAAPIADPAERQERALAAAGLFRTGDTDLAEEHDRYLAEAYSA